LKLFNRPLLSSNRKLFLYDFLLLSLMMVLAGCGLIYEYIFAHYAGRVLGSMETVLYSIIGIMIVSMGVGALLASRFKNPYFTLSILESLIGIFAILGIFVISGTHGLAFQLPELIAENYNIDADISLKGGVLDTVYTILTSTSYIMAGLVGVLIGMEIPLVARIREDLHKKHLKNNAGMIYGADYIGAGIGALIWVVFLLKLDISVSMGLVAVTNVISGFIFILAFKDKIGRLPLVLSLQIATIFIIYFGVNNINNWQNYLEDSLYVDEKVFSMNTKYQRIALTKEKDPYTNENLYNFFINGRTQFSQADEIIYHNLLVYPAMNIAKKTDDVLIIGGGDGLALRDVLMHDVKKVTMLDLDSEIVDFFKNPHYVNNEQINKTLLELNDYSFSDKRLNVYFGDAFINGHKLMTNKEKFDVIIIDLPDPSHPDLNKLYSKPFYKMLNNILNDNGSLVIQSTSPYHAKKAFLSIKKTVENASFTNVEQYHYNVPSFGEWGWTIATKNNLSPKKYLKNLDDLKINSEWINLGIINGSFYFGNNYYDIYNDIKVNEQGSGVIYTYHQNAWYENKGYADVN
jgi:spermidine synthase